MLFTFKDCISPVLKEEGGYVNLPTDAGGETYRGIARNFNPSWEGWPLIDARKTSGEIPRYWTNGQLDALAWPYYQIEYWEKYELEKFSQALRYPIFDSVVMSGANTYGIIKQAANMGKWDKSKAGSQEASYQISQEAFILARLDYFLYLARLNANYRVSVKGWTERLTRVYSRNGGQNADVFQRLQTAGV